MGVDAKARSRVSPWVSPGATNPVTRWRHPELPTRSTPRAGRPAAAAHAPVAEPPRRPAACTTPHRADPPTRRPPDRPAAHASLEDAHRDGCDLAPAHRA